MKKKLSLFFAGVAFCLYTQQAYGMHFAKAAVRGLWNNKITLTGAGFVANGFSEYADSWNDNYERIKLVSFYGAAETPWIPIQEKMKIEKAFQDRGLKVTLITMEENTPRPAIGVSVIGDHACFFLNPVAIQAFWNEKDNVYFPRVEYTADEMRTAFHHELVHVDERDNEKVLAVKASLPTVIFVLQQAFIRECAQLCPNILAVKRH